jgi:hypothetical protein|tara:strand:+ start:4025 stop:4771 length:747 start_codon:yes stop_codon:yes gene_type:complete
MTATTTISTRSWQRHPATQVTAVAVVCVPPYTFAIWSHLTEQSISLTQLFLFPLVVGGGCVALTLVVYRFICGERIATLNLRPGRWYSDLLVGIALAAAFLSLFVLQQAIQSTWLAHLASPPAEEIITFLNGVANDPLLLAIWLGPVAWLGVATFEELMRVFMLNRLWKVWPGTLGRWLVILASAAVFGLAHIYQGPLNAVAVGVQGLLYACYYLRFGRYWPMIIGHALYDSVQVLQIAMVFRGATAS